MPGYKVEEIYRQIEIVVGLLKMVVIVKVDFGEAMDINQIFCDRRLSGADGFYVSMVSGLGFRGSANAIPPHSPINIVVLDIEEDGDGPRVGRRPEKKHGK